MVVGVPQGTDPPVCTGPDPACGRKIIVKGVGTASDIYVHVQRREWWLVFHRALIHRSTPVQIQPVGVK